MGENKRTVAMARMELEDLYSGIPDDSVNLTFQDMARVDPPTTIKPTISINKKSHNRLVPNPPTSKNQEPITRLGSFNKIPSLDFNKGLEATQTMEEYVRDSSNIIHNHHRLMQGGPTVVGSPRSSSVVMLDAVSYERSSPRNNSSAVVMASPYQGSSSDHHRQQTPANNYHHPHGRVAVTPPYSPNDFSRSSVGTPMYDLVGKGGGRRPGIPHSNICTICSTYIYIFKNRCLVCGRVYCRNCVNMGMGNMTEGRKCIECVGRRFSARYIRKAGNVGCCFRYPAAVKQEELKWAEKGPRRSGERAYGSQQGNNRNLKSGSSTPAMASPLTPSRNPPSYLMGSPFSPYSSSNHHLPL